jgi:hypothetical protein
MRLPTILDAETPLSSLGAAWGSGMRVRQRRTAERFFVDNAIIDQYGKQLGPYGLAVYTALCRHADIDSQRCFPGHRLLADETGMSISSVKNAVSSLVALGLVSVKRRRRERGGQTSNLYTLLAPPSQQVTAPQSPAGHPPVTKRLPPSHQAATNNPNKEQSSLDNLPPDGGGAAASRPDSISSEKRADGLRAATPLQLMACQAFNHNGSFANETQKKRFLALESTYPEPYLKGRIDWATNPKAYKGFDRFEAAVRNPDNYQRWKAKQKEESHENQTAGGTDGPGRRQSSKDGSPTDVFAKWKQWTAENSSGTTSPTRE